MFGGVMNKRKWSFLLISVSVIVVVTLGILMFGRRRTDSMFPYRDKSEINECYVYFSAEKNKDKRVEFLKKWVKKYFGDMEVHRLYQDFMITLGESDAIFKEYQDYRLKNTSEPMFNYLMARLAPANEAEELYKKSLENNDNFYWGHLGLAYYYTHQSNPQKLDLAKEHLAKAIQIDKTKPNAYFSYLTVYRFEGNYEKMHEMLAFLTQFFPDRDYLFLEYADLHFKDQNERRKALEKKLRVIPKSALIKKAIADSLLFENKKDEALRYLEEAIQDGPFVDPNQLIGLHMQIADIYGIKQSSAQVLAHLKEAVKAGLKDAEWIKENKNFAFLRDNGEFQDLIKGLEPVKKEPEKPKVPEKK